MITFIKAYNLDMIKKKLLILYLLNITDILFTLLLLRTGFFAEVNILMVDAVQSPLASFLLKVILPGILLYYLYRRICISDLSQLRATNIGVNISLFIYALVNLSHIIWFALLPVFYNTF